MSETYSEPPDAWTELDAASYDEVWARFDRRFSFRPGVDPKTWPALREPTPSVTFDLSVIPDGPRRGAAYDAINSEALRAFVWSTPDLEELFALDWQHPAYRFRPADQALTWQAEWKISIYPDGDYYAFLADDFSEGTFGHPWERTLCIIGPRLCASLGRSLVTWLPIKRQDGLPI